MALSTVEGSHVDAITDFIIGPGAITTLTKLVTDALRTAFPGLSGAGTLLTAFIASLVGAGLILAASGRDINRISIATAVIQAILATAGAVGVTELQKNAGEERVQKKVQRRP
jgi:hypothetical protein